MAFPIIAEADAAQMQLEWGEWKPMPRVSRQIPFGYKVSEDDPDTLLPIELELEALERAKLYKQKGHSLRNIAEWLHKVTGRSYSHQGLKKRIEADNERRARAKTLRLWAAQYKEAIQKAYEWDQKHTGLPEEAYQKLLDPEFDPAAFGRGAYKRY